MCLSGIVIEMIKAGGVAILHVITNMINLIIKKEQIPDDRDWSTINIFSNRKVKLLELQ